MIMWATQHASIAALVVSLAACAGSAVATPPVASPSAGSPSARSTATQPASGIGAFRQPRPGLWTGGRPTQADLQAAAAQGVQVVISLLPNDEFGDEPTQVTALGMTLVSIPISGAADLTEDNARKLGELLAAHRDHPVLLHCASGNRVGALLALEAYYVEGMRASDAISLGVRAGLASLESTVRAQLNAACATQTDRC